MTVNVDHAAAKRHLESTWSKLETIQTPDATPAQLIQQILSAKDVTFKYLLITGILAKLTNPSAHPRAIQASSSLSGAYDARSLCHSIIVPFEKTKGNLWGLSNEPYVNKPARHPEHRGDNPQLRNGDLARTLHKALEAANSSSPTDVERMLAHCLRIGKTHAASIVSANIDTDVNLKHVISFVHEFLKETGGGARLAAVAGAFIVLNANDMGVKIHPPNASDTFAKTAGDIEVFADKKLIMAFECKHRPMNLADVEHGLKKAKERGVQEYCFIIASGMTEESRIIARIEAASDETDASVLNIYEVCLAWSVMLTPVRRSMFGETVAQILNGMRLQDQANAAATLWNSLK